MILMRGAMLVRMAKECVSKTEASRVSWPARERRRKRQKEKEKKNEVGARDGVVDASRRCR